MILMGEILNEPISLSDKKKFRNLKLSLLKQNKELVPVILPFGYTGLTSGQ